MNSKALDAYIDAIRALRALEQAAKEDGTPACGQSRLNHDGSDHDFVGHTFTCEYSPRREAIKDARDEVKFLASRLTARDHWLAQRQLSAPVTPP